MCAPCSYVYGWRVSSTGLESRRMWAALSESWQWAVSWLAVIDAIVVLVAIPVILSVKKEATSAVAWCLLVVFIPILGALFFLVFGYQSIYRPLKRKKRHRQRY